MIKSMTGYGSAKGTSGNIGISIELRSVNNRYLDCSIRLPRMYTAVEDPIKAEIGKSVSRGKLDVYINLDTSAADDTVITLNEPLARAYFDVFKRMSQEFDIPNDLTTTALSRFSDILRVEKVEADKNMLFADILSVLKEALVGYNAMRAAEGDRLRSDVLSRLELLDELVTTAEQRSPVTLAEYRERLTQKMMDVLSLTGIDQQRILTEAAIFADKIAIDEETVRLRSHISQMRGMLDLDEPIGRKLDFIVQEMNREANTIGSKGNDLEMAKTVVEMKSVIEKIREQIQNIE